MLTDEEITRVLARPADALDALDRIDCEESLYAYGKRMWSVLEPANPMVDGWPMEAITEHLSAVTDGHIQKLLITVPPGFSKSMWTEVLWPSWEWGPRRMPWLRYVSFSYSSMLTQRDNRRFRDIMLSHDYSRLFGDRLSLLKIGEELVSNDRTGWKLATSVGGVGTGERGDRVVCLPADQRILTDVGMLPIGEIVERRLPVRIAGFDHTENAVSWQRIDAYETNPGGDILEIEWDGGSLKCTPDHQIFVPGQGYTRADQLRPGQYLYRLPELLDADQAQAKCTAEILQQGMPISASKSAGDRSEQPSVPAMRQDGLSASSALEAGAGRVLLQPQMSWPRQPWREEPRLYRIKGSDLRELRHPIPQEKPKSQMLFDRLREGVLESSAWGRMGSSTQMRALRERVHGSYPEQPILFEDLRFGGSRPSNEGRWKWPVRARGGYAAISAGLDANLQDRHPTARRQPVRDVRSFAGAGPQSRRAPHRLPQGKSGPVEPDHALPLVPRASAWPVGGSIAVVRNIKRHAAISRTYNLNVAPHHNYFAEGILVHNCDDPHNVKESESDTVRQETIRWFREGMSNRLNHADKSAVVIIMQRVHESDVAGVVLSEMASDYQHLSIPMEWEGQTRISTVPAMKWTKDPRTEIGQLAWPERFSPKATRNLKTTVGPYAWAGQYQQVPTPRGGGIFREEWWQHWDGDDGEIRRFPRCDFVVASLDGAFGQKQENDYTALTIWGIFKSTGESPVVPTHYLEQALTGTPKRREALRGDVQRRFGVPKIILMHAWQKRLPLHGPEVHRETGETEAEYRRRAMPSWGVVEWVADSCRRKGVNVLLIEAKANGIDVANEIRRLYSGEGWGIQLVDPGRLDKVARAYSVQPIFADHMVHAPTDLEWADMVIQQMKNFPKTAHDDLVDSSTQAIKFLRDMGLAVHQHEIERDVQEIMKHASPLKPLYSV